MCGTVALDDMGFARPKSDCVRDEATFFDKIIRSSV